ncbi:hypothetical protein NB721_001229 [Xanthomonas sacchari]|nr:hypothetical protein [Xanthomonas sacchari]
MKPSLIRTTPGFARALVAAAIDVFPGFACTLICPFGAPSPGGRRGARGAWSPSPPGRGVGVRVRGEAFAHQSDTRLRPRACRRCDRGFPRLRQYPHPPLRGTFSRREKGSAWRLEPLSPRERGWGEGTGRSLRASERHQAAPARLSPLRSMSSQASPVPSSAPAGHFLPVGEGRVLRWNVVAAALCEGRSGLTAAQSSRVLFPQPVTASTRSDAFLPTMGARPVFRSGNESVSPPSP